MFNPNTATTTVTPKDIYACSIENAIAFLSKNGYEVIDFRNVIKSNRDTYLGIAWNVIVHDGYTNVYGPRFILRKKESWKNLTFLVNYKVNDIYKNEVNIPEDCVVDSFRLPKVNDLVLSVYGYTYTAAYTGDAPRLILKRKES